MFTMSTVVSLVTTSNEVFSKEIANTWTSSFLGRDSLQNQKYFIREAVLDFILGSIKVFDRYQTCYSHH